MNDKTEELEVYQELSDQLSEKVKEAEAQTEKMQSNINLKNNTIKELRAELEKKNTARTVADIITELWNSITRQ